MSNEKKVGRPITNDSVEKKQFSYEKNKNDTNKRIKDLNDTIKKKNKEKLQIFQDMFPNSKIKATAKGISIYVSNIELEKY